MSSITIKDLIVTSFMLIWFAVCNIFIFLNVESFIIPFQVAMILIFGVIVLVDRLSIKADEWMNKIIWKSKS